MSQTLEELIAAGQTGQIDCLPLYVAQLQLRIHLTLLLGDHAATGRAMAAYSAVMLAASNHFTQHGGPAGASDDDRPRLLATLERHGAYAEYAGRRLLAYGGSHEFVDQSDQANATWDATFDATRTSVAKVFSLPR